MLPKLAADDNQNGQPPKESSQEILRNLLGQIEGELYRSEVYHRAITTLQPQNPQNGQTSQAILKALTREAIGIALKTLIQHRATSGTQQSLNPTPAPQQPPTSGFKPFFFGSSNSQAWKLNSKQVADENCAIARTERLRQIGQELRTRRQAKFLSLQQLHWHTLVPLPHLESLENGQIERLPEDIYVRGFVRRLGDALGLNGTQLAASIPTPDSAKSVVPSWQQAEPSTGFNLRTGHLYVGYAALMAGAVSGLSLLSNNSNSQTPPQPDSADKSLKPFSQSSHRELPIKKPGLNSGSTGLASAEIAPPEIVMLNR
ncbi:helix-turn-helix domain-containing protein [Ancylothrix sp. C2]|uniref:helix-turn-helix domain-containing protein n=1 Tax=Ancylothrix sp. D3o TaxID=2953691 RepID=UPI0021BA8A46|nr:helix-turn-helix domain-containing protein [Ancylothrix sp. D3o]MCT7951838.1 helix-turn-helix domain-containing protein [Ancylothrix sp. D3o]